MGQQLFALAVVYTVREERVRMLKQIVCIALVASALSAADAAIAAAPAHIYVKGKLVLATDSPIVEKGRTLVPLSAVAGPLALRLSWNAADKTATFGKWNESVRLTVGSSTAVASGNPAHMGGLKLDSPVHIVKGRVYVPLRFLAEQFGYRVSVDDENVRILAPLDASQLAMLRDGDLAEARRRTMSLSPELTHYAVDLLPYTHEREGYNVTYLFPEGRSDRFIVVSGDQASYAELTEDGWIVKWQAHIPVGEKDTLELLWEMKVTDQRGTAPEMNGSYLFWSSTDHLTTNLLSSGRLSDAGKEILGWRSTTSGESGGQAEGELSLTLPGESRLPGWVE
ncbi:copper amine oxidase N-terminal domain-containing protein [Cohnella hashimotonis]|uniref:Copper amine oxidase N-terminal domain-containing protein n=1 Tax=Cohnella hashimotonis TaxID=2826895 RepID=A0ABT6TAM7_9BACL|nr:copper amine oxidase N-terminal domain-containing protein [Cohnella hashimotonis]MDI4643894.1 copper amine oxidase N-terminal domain-containing protein [Cohnella hashimotonis]